MLPTLTLAVCVTAASLTGHPAPQPCQFDAADHHVYVLAAPAQATERVQVRQHHRHARWHTVGHLPSSGRGDFTTRLSVDQFTIAVTVGGHRCETT